MIFKFIFYKAYLIAIRIFKEQEFPWAFGSLIVAICIVTSIVIMLELLEYTLLPLRVNMYGSFYGYFAIGFWMLVQIYVTRGKKYQKILRECQDIPEERRKRLGLISIIYIGILIVGFFGLGHLIRDYNINH